MSGDLTDILERVGEIVEAAQAGDRRAFDALVLRFQDMAVGTAYGWLGDSHAAQDAAQEAFVETYLHLDQLNEPAAFPGFLRRVVLKHCDRRTRGRSADAVSLDAQRERSVEPPPDASLAEREDRARVRAAVEQLPAHERLVVSLHYLGGLTQAEVADWLEVPLSTVKKRLHSARRRLREGWEDMFEETFEALRPSRNDEFSEKIQLFLAIRAGDVLLVEALLDRSPDLVEAEERWEAEITRTHALPAPNGGTPLVRAAERNQVEMIDLLLQRGAEINRACTCTGGERPLWAAVANGQVGAARRLLECGAAADVPAFADHTPLHVAALRGFEAIVALLLEHGADRARLDRGGRTPADWAKQNGHAGIVAQLAGSPLECESAPWPVAPDPEGPGARFVETGIKALDLFAPLAPGAIARTRFEPGQGAILLLGELSLRWWRRTGSPAPAVVWVGWERQPSDRGEFDHAFAEIGLGAAARLIWSPASDDADHRRGTLDSALDEALRLQGAGAPDVLMVVFARPGFAAEIDASLPLIGRRDGRSITLIVAERDGEPAVDDGPLRPPFDARIAFDSRLASMRHFPAVHPLASLSNVALDAEHARVACEARTLLSRYRTLVPDLGEGDTPLTDAEQLLVGRARRLEAYLTQPFLSAEAFSGKPGSVVPLAGTLEDIARILAGELDTTDLTQISFRGRLA